MKITVNDLKFLVKQMLQERMTKDNQFKIPSEVDSKKHYEILFFQQELMRNDFSKSMNESQASVLQDINNDIWEETDPKSFMNSLYSSKRLQFLTPYDQDDFIKMKLYKVKNEFIGFAIKNDGDVVAVHNNSSYGGLGSALMSATIRNGGTKLDHFDGFLTGLYQTNGFSKVVKKELWNEEYAPDKWGYDPVDIFSFKTSAYANEKEIQKLKQNPQEIKNIGKNYNITWDLLHAIRNYKTGRPSIIYREI